MTSAGTIRLTGTLAATVACAMPLGALSFLMGGMPMINDRTIDVLSRSSGALIIGAVLLVGAAIGLGVSINSAEHLLDVRTWARAIGDCLRGL